MADATPEYWEESHFSQKSVPSTQIRSMQLLPSQHRDEATSGSHFFTKLPGEIRTQIYRYAFGDRVFHVNLHICSTACWTRGGACGSAEPRNHVSTSNSVRCHDRYWWGSICNHSLSGSWKNTLCTDIHGAHFIVDQSKPSDMTSTGVTGWLMSCQQACVIPNRNADL